MPGMKKPVQAVLAGLLIGALVLCAWLWNLQRRSEAGSAERLAALEGRQRASQIHPAETAANR